MTEYMYAFTTNATKIVPQSRSPRIQRSSNITKIYHQIFHRHGHLPYLLLLGSFYYYLFKLFFTNTFSLFTFFFSIISISTTGYSPLYKQITQVHLVQEITTNMKLLVTLPVRHKLLIFFFSIFIFFINVLHFLNF